jgi:hypothetical protein
VPRLRAGLVYWHEGLAVLEHGRQAPVVGCHYRDLFGLTDLNVLPRVLRVAPPTEIVQTATYFDTRDPGPLSAQITLRRRTGGLDGRAEAVGRVPRPGARLGRDVPVEPSAVLFAR